ncbi:MAG: glutaminase A [Actinomycetota bacterium]|uniref:Glutaminase n=1 Tax=Mycobacterium lentiflavum TaxID=141349 RepID=A0ABY3UYT3_MYCLN|nr:glutaminase A [Mycobacterium lentiflavum]MEE3064223.1 glutaminase A [Actinomycetota bacterium]ULP42342.1 glutaminase A [Mycobacterium lentiflavum]
MQLPLDAELNAIFDEVAGMDAGKVADYIPALREANPDWFGVSLVTVDSHRYDVGDSEQSFTIQSVSKPFAYAMALEKHGIDAVLQRVGVEPSGDPFNSIEFDMTTRRPYNPMVNAGAIMTSSLLDGAAAVDAGFARFAGRALKLDEEVFQSESDSGDRNRAIAYLMRNFGMLEAEVETTLQAYFRQCALLVDARDLATMGATLANRGVNPMTGERAVSGVNVVRVLSAMSTCGMYDYAGEWLYNVGLPAKSGVSGAVLAVMPGQFGLAIFSPRLDSHGNSVRGIGFCKAVSERFSLHLFSPAAVDHSVVRRAYGGDIVRSNRHRLAFQDSALKRLGSTTRVLELQGQLRFGSCEVLSRAIAAELDDAEVMILDFRRVSAVGRSASKLLRAIGEMFEKSPSQVVVAAAPREVAESLGALSFDALADALEWREDQLLERADLEPGPARIPLADVEVLHGVDADLLPMIEAAGTYRRYQDGEMIFNAGDRADRIYFLVEGRVDVVLVMGETFARATTLGPGATFGEMAALYGGARSAGVRAAMPSVCFELEVAELDRLSRDRPGISLQLHTNIGRALANRVGQLSDEVAALRQ